MKALLLCGVFGFGLAAAPLPQIVRQGSKYAFLVEGKPYLILGAQVNNSSGWPSQVEKLLPAAAALHLNTIEVPVYWEDVEPEEGQFRFNTVDRILQLAREQHFRLVLLWFGTWKNGTMDYAPNWVKANTNRFPRMLDDAGHPVRVLTPLSETNLQADQRAYSQLMGHLKLVDGEQHTVILVQVENESGSLFTDRDHSPAANREFAGQVPASLLKALHKTPGTWKEAFGAEADEAFAAYYVSRYVNAVAAAGKREYALPAYANVWLREQKNFMRPGEAYPSGGATLNMLDLWKAMTPSLDAVAPDNYVLDYVNYGRVLAGYRRPDNPLLVPETGGPRVASNLFYALGDYDALGYAPFGLDRMVEGGAVKERAQAFAEDCRLLQPALP
jgi:beta-galactosidase GanA